MVPLKSLQLNVSFQETADSSLSLPSTTSASLDFIALDKFYYRPHRSTT